MEIKTVSKEKLFAVGVATGQSQTGEWYQNILVSGEEKSSIRSPFSIYLDLNDRDMMKDLGINDIEDFRNEDGSRKVTPIKPVSLGPGKLVTVKHAPYGVSVAGRPKPRVIWSTTVVVRGDESVPAAAEAAVGRAFERADFLAKNTAYYGEYKKYVLFLASKEEFEELLKDVEVPED